MVVENCCLLAQLLDGAVFILSVLQNVLRFACYEQALLLHLVASYRYLGLKLCVQSTCLMYNVPGGRQLIIIINVHMGLTLVVTKLQ